MIKIKIISGFANEIEKEVEGFINENKVVNIYYTTDRVHTAFIHYEVKTIKAKDSKDATRTKPRKPSVSTTNNTRDKRGRKQPKDGEES